MNLKNLYQNEYSFEETINENSFKIESFSHLSIEDTITNSNDNNVISKALYLIVDNNDTLFADKINQIACYHNNLGWIFYQPKIGDIAYIQSFEGFYYFDGESWNVFNSGSGGEGGSSGSSKKVDNPFFLRFRMNCKELPDNYSWLKSDANAKDATIYSGLYNKLVDIDTNGASGTLTMAGNTYNTKEQDGFVVLSSNDWLTIYQNNGIVDAYGLDVENQQFYLPYNIETKRVLIEKKEPTSTDKSWYNLYSDGWVEQGGEIEPVVGDWLIPTFSIEMRDIYYSIRAIQTRGASSWNTGFILDVRNNKKTTTSFAIYLQYNSYQTGLCWSVCGYTNRVSTLNVNYYDY